MPERPQSVDPSSAVRPGVPRTTVQARLPDGRLFDAPVGTTLRDILKAAFGPLRPAGMGCPAEQIPVVAAVVNGRLRELTIPLHGDATVVPVTLASSDGMRIYRRSLAFLLLVAAAEVYPEAEIFIDHAAPSVGAYFCGVHGRPPFEAAELAEIEQRMRDIVAADAPMTKVTLSRQQAMALFQSRGEDDTLALLAHRPRETVVLDELRGRRDYFHGYLTPSAGCLRYFALHGSPPGFLLRFPRRSHPTSLEPLAPYPKLFAAFEEAGFRLDRLGIRSTGALNSAIEAGRLPEVSLVAEALHEARLAQIASDIASAQDRLRVVLIAGPSASGKTTFAKRLAIQLLAHGLRPCPVGLDDYFVERDQTPRDELGQLDYESIEALDLDLFNQQLQSLIAERSTELPHYDFKSGRRERGATVTLGRDSIILVEGIHGLNPALVTALPPESVYRVYVSVLTQLNLDRHNRVSTTDCRLIRRVVRDASTRGYSPTSTLRRWDSVIRGERRWIFPFQENSDAIFDSALVHELALLRPFAEPLLLQVRPEEPEHVDANRLLAFLQWFRPATADPVPDNSILREFIGGSVLDRFHLWASSPTRS